jgi:Ca2+-binding EF-hand superfamily protein
MRYVHLKKVKHIRKRQTQPLVRKDIIKDYDRRGSVAKESLVAILKRLGAKMPVVK